MLMLRGSLPVLNRLRSAPYLVTVTKDASLPEKLRSSCALLQETNQDPMGFKAVLTLRPEGLWRHFKTDVFELTPEYRYIDEGDILRLDPTSGKMRCLFRRSAASNTLLLTEQCDHYCLMCSQPPKVADDSWLLKQAFEVVSMLPGDTRELIFSGGEPTLYGDQLVGLLAHTKQCLPNTAVHLLSNGTAFKNIAFAQLYASVEHPDLMVGIPVYSDDPATHDYVVQRSGAFDDTIRGIVNLKKLRQRVEIRLVIHKKTVSRLRQTCEFFARNLLFVDHVALMALEITGFTKANLPLLWIDPYEYKDLLSEAVTLLNAYGVPTSVYNHPLCTVNPDILPNYRRSISDWKSEYLADCVRCSRRSECGGLFSSAVKYMHSNYIRPFP